MCAMRRSYVTGCFQEGCDDNLDTLTPAEMKEVDRWLKFYDNHKEYKFVGYLDTYVKKDEKKEAETESEKTEL
jgi:hypothetical protein